MEGHILFRYPGGQAKLFTIGEGEDSFYLCPFVDKKAQIYKGNITPYSSEKINLYEGNEKPYISSKNEYLSHFNAFKEGFKKEGISKAILSRVKAIDISLQNPERLFEKMCSKYPNAFCYLMSIQGKGTWAGASPEILLTYEENKIKTVALAGTKYSADEKVWTPKEYDEHKLVEDYIADLENEQNQLCKRTSPHIVQAGQLFHLRSEFEFIAEKNDIVDFLERIHPTPAICGLPYQKSKKLILETESHNRNLYCGYIGVVSSKTEKFSMYVNIRCMQLFNNRAYLYIGGGITEESVGESEWEETEKKSMTMGALFY